MNKFGSIAVLGLSALLVLPAWSGHTANARDYLMAVKELMVEKLGIPDSVKFSNLRMATHPQDHQAMLCGWLTVETIPGEATASAPFISFIDTESMRAISASIDDGTGVVRRMCR